jgi:hypothetical protein
MPAKGGSLSLGGIGTRRNLPFGNEAETGEQAGGEKSPLSGVSPPMGSVSETSQSAPPSARSLMRSSSGVRLLSQRLERQQVEMERLMDDNEQLRRQLDAQVSGCTRTICKGVTEWPASIDLNTEHLWSFKMQVVQDSKLLYVKVKEECEITS